MTDRAVLSCRNASPGGHATASAKVGQTLTLFLPQLSRFALGRLSKRGSMWTLVKTNHELSHTPEIAAARVVLHGEQLKANHRIPRVFFKARDGSWLPIETPIADIPAEPSRQQRLSALLVQAKRLHGEISSLLESRHAGHA